MNLRKITLASLVFLALALSSCNATRRAGKDGYMLVTSPWWILYGGGTDALATANAGREGVGGSGFTEAIIIPFAFLYHGLKHTVYAFIHGIDLVFYPLYGVADLHPYGPDIEPLDLYTGTWFDKPEEGSLSSTDAETGEKQPDAKQ